MAVLLFDSDGKTLGFDVSTRDYNAAACIEKIGLIEYETELEKPLPHDLILSSSVTLNSSPVEPGSTPVETKVTAALLEKLNAIHGMTANYC